MMTEELKISQKDMRLILSAASPDAALVYLYIKSGNALGAAAGDLHLSESRLGCAEATLRQLGLLADDRVSRIAPGERPGYSERDVLEAMDGDAGFRGLYGEVQRLLGRSLNTEELKILLGFVRYLGMTPELISVLVCYCKDRARRKGSRAGHRHSGGCRCLHSGPECPQFPALPADGSAADPGQEPHCRRRTVCPELAGFGNLGGTDCHGLRAYLPEYRRIELGLYEQNFAALA